MPKFKRGTQTAALPGNASFVVLGGPTVILSTYWYTAMCVTEGMCELSPGRLLQGEVGVNYMIPSTYIVGKAQPLEWTELAIRHAQKRFAQGLDADYISIPVQDCPSCDIEKMIFYSGDYICSWCREMMEA